MERRQFGKTDMQVSVLGFGGGEIGFEGANEETVARLLKGGMDGGINVIESGEGYSGREELMRETVLMLPEKIATSLSLPITTFTGSVLTSFVTILSATFRWRSRLRMLCASLSACPVSIPRLSERRSPSVGRRMREWWNKARSRTLSSPRSASVGKR